jgi:hypothetical protein
MREQGYLPLAYRSDYFVDREEALAVVLEKARALLRKEPVRNRTTTYYGPRGSGKSWLLRELYYRLQNTAEFQNQVTSLFIALGPATAGIPSEGFHIPADERAERWPLLTVGDLMENIAVKLGLGTPPSTSVDALGSHIVKSCRRQGGPVVVLVDGVDEMPPDFLRELENHFLAPLSLEPYVLIALGGRIRDPRKYVWKMPELRLYADEVWLEPFAEEDTREQLARLSSLGLSPKAAPEVQKEGNGYPLSNVVLATHLEGDPPQWKDKGAALRECANLLLENVDSKLRDYFRALCVLRSFDEMRMPPLLAVWSDTPAEHWDYQRCRRIREDMVAARLARWRESQGFVMDEAVRVVLENDLRENEPQRWRALHQAAYDLFTDWANRYPTAKERWMPEAEYHQQFIRFPQSGAGRRRHGRSGNDR